MLSDDLNSLANSIGELAGTVPRGVWENLSGIRNNLRSLAGQVRQIEVHFVPPGEDAARGDSHERSH